MDNSIIRESSQDFYTRMAVYSCPNATLNQYLPRVLRNDSQTYFEENLHRAMGWKASTVDDWA